MEIEDQARSLPCDAQIRNRLRQVDLIDRLNRLQFNYQPAFNKEIDPAFTNHVSFVVELYARFAFESNAAQAKLVRQRITVVRFEVAPAKNAMYFNRGADDF